jgi:hypothetical protein
MLWRQGAVLVWQATEPIPPIDPDGSIGLSDGSQHRCGERCPQVEPAVRMVAVVGAGKQAA